MENLKNTQQRNNDLCERVKAVYKKTGYKI